MREWELLKERVLKNEPLCRVCKQRASTELHAAVSQATEMHAIPPNKFVPVCEECHRAEHAQDCVARSETKEGINGAQS